MNYLLKHFIEGKIEGRLEVTGRRGIRLKQLLVDVKDSRGYRKLEKKHLIALYGELALKESTDF